MQEAGAHSHDINSFSSYGHYKVKGKINKWKENVYLQLEEAQDCFSFAKWYHIHCHHYKSMTKDIK